MALVSIVVPVYHNAKSLPDLVVRLEQLASSRSEQFEFVFVDDGSRDDSFRVIERLAQRNPRVRGVKLARNFGSNAASAAGIACARGNAVVAISADLQDPPELISEMLDRWRQGFRVVLAARRSRQDPWLIKFTSKLYWRLLRRFAIPTMPPGGCDFCLLDRQVLDALQHTHEPNAGIGMVLWTGFDPAVIYYDRGERDQRYGRSMWSWSKRVTYLIDNFVSFSHLPVRAASVLGIVLGTVGFVYAAVVVISILVFGAREYPAWASTMVAILVVGGAQLLMTGILGEYVLRALEASRRRPPYVIERVYDTEAAGESQIDPAA